ncbi:MAG: hypothetical protein PHT69_17055 [Bacteroidales bacterium]|nr:hypothetical protein [Bacteroidales bacterium]
MDYFNNDNIDLSERRNTAFTLVRALREAISTARRLPVPITYEKTLDMVYDLDEKLYAHVVKLIETKNESDTVKYYKQKAIAKSEGLFQFSPTDIIQEEINEHQDLLEKSNDPDSLKFIKSKIRELKGALEYFQPRRISEHKILNRDFNSTLKNEYFNNKIYENECFKDYELSDDRILRLRLLHPDKEEEILGADLIYEYFDLLEDKVRFVHLQYKTWEEKTLYLNQGNITAQINKMIDSICNSGFCRDNIGNKYSDNYRLPYCSAFFRPTNKIQENDSRLISTGIHIPMCEVIKLMNKEGKITYSNIRDNYITYKNFTDLFISNLLGSRWIPISMLEKYYKEKNINAFTGRLRVHAQEVKTYSEEEIQKNKPK